MCCNYFLEITLKVIYRPCLENKNGNGNGNEKQNSKPKQMWNAQLETDPVATLFIPGH